MYEEIGGGGEGSRLRLDELVLDIERPGSRLITLDGECHVLDVCLGGAVSDYSATGDATAYAEPCPPGSWRFLRADTVRTIALTRTGTTLRASIAPSLLAAYADAGAIEASGGEHRFDDALIGAATILVDHLSCPGREDDLAAGRTDDFTPQACSVLLGRLGRCLSARANAAEERSPYAGRPDAVQRALAYIEANLERALPLERVAEAAGLSQYHFARLFRAATGTTLHRYVLERRLGRARELLLHSDHALADIAYLIGFGSQSHMTTLFRKHLGRTPGEIRRTSLAQPDSESSTASLAMGVAVRGESSGPEERTSVTFRREGGTAEPIARA